MNKMKSSAILNLKPKTSYTLQWWDIDTGSWSKKIKANTDKNGLLKMPQKPDERGWAYRILE
jgi:hypothetical protein